MANSKTTYLEKAVIDYFLRPGATQPTRPSAHYVALFTAVANGEAGTVTEVTGGAYARQAVTFGASSDNSGAERTSNTALIQFPVATADYPAAVTHFGVYDASTGGNLLLFDALATPQTILTGNRAEIAAGALTHDES